MKPGISAENLVCAFTSKCYLVIFCDPGAKVKHGGFHICHAGQVSGIHSFIKTFQLFLIAALQIVMAGLGKGYHLLCKRTVLAGLEGIRLEIFLVILKVKGEGIQHFPLFFQLPGADGGHQAAVQTAG